MKRENIPVPEEIRIFTFRVRGICFGMDMDQIAGMRSPDQINSREYRICGFEEKLPFRRFGTDSADAGNSPMILILNDREKISGIYIEHPEGINVCVSIDSIRPMPPLTEASDKSSPIWGVALTEKRMILLTDFYRLIARQDEKRSGDF